MIAFRICASIALVYSVFGVAYVVFENTKEAVKILCNIWNGLRGFGH
ncbi:MAG: hypothetical protein ACI9ZD_001033, partial [Paracoccaceae bacterium]